MAPHAASLKERQRQEREKLILQAASKLMMERGYHDTSLEDIAASVGIAKGTIYLHFARKEDLVIAMFEQGVRSFIKTLEDALDSAATPHDKLMAVIEHSAMNMPTHGLQAFMAMMQNPEVHTRMAERRDEMGKLWEGPVRRLAAVVDQGKASGDFDPELPTPLIVHLMMSLLTPRGHGQLMEEAQMTPAQVTANLSRFFFKGIAAESSEYPTSDKN